jgi:hypothetical protein
VNAVQSIVQVFCGVNSFLLAVITHVNTAFPDEHLPNYLQNCGGAAAIQHLINAKASLLPNSPIYHPAYIFNNKFPLHNFCIHHKCVLNGVSINQT